MVRVNAYLDIGGSGLQYAGLTWTGTVSRKNGLSMIYYMQTILIM